VLAGDVGGRFKKEVIVDGQSYLLLIRDEGGAPDMQVGDDAVHTLLSTLFVIRFTAQLSLMLDPLRTDMSSTDDVGKDTAESLSASSHECGFLFMWNALCETLVAW